MTFTAFFQRFYTINAALLIALTNLFSFRLFIATLAFAGSIDLLRVWLHKSIKINTIRPSLSYLLRYFSFVIALIVAIILVTLWYYVPDICTPALNTLIESNIGIVESRMAALGPACDVPRGSLLVWTQAVLPATVLFMIGIDGIFFDIDQSSFIRTTKKISRYKQRSPAFIPMLIFLYIIIFFIAWISNFEAESVGYRPTVPQYQVSVYVAFIVLIYLSTFTSRIVLAQITELGKLDYGR
ncbi:hypothetical protein [Bauldia sp.]|uniref:hypothetical protein n=1 Tax=Bauldia sp. TaxID=2575872 RepID=UPI003BAAB9E8